jgi:hypothetical protein
MTMPKISDMTMLATQLLDQEPRTTVLSFDPGGDADYAALALLVFAAEAPRYTRPYLCQRVVRFVHGMDYGEIERRVVQSYQDVIRQRDAEHWARWGHVSPGNRPPRGQVIALVERNGVGRAMIDGLRRQGVEVVSVWTSGGDGWATQPSQFTVALNDIVRTLLQVWGHKRLWFAQFSEDELKLLEQECRDYEHHLTQGGRSTYRSRAGAHDDVLRALAQGIAWCEHGQPWAVRTLKVLGV